MNNRSGIVIVTFLAMVLFGIIMQSISPLMPVLIDEFGLSHTQGGLLVSLFALPGIFFSIPGGFWADIHGPKKVGILSFLLMLVGNIIIATGSSFAALAVGRFIAGIGGTTVVIAAAQALTRAFINNRGLGAAMGIFNAGVPAGTIFAHNVFSRVVTVWGWQVPILFSALACLLMLVVFWRCLETESVFAQRSENNTSAAVSGRIMDSMGYLRDFRFYWGVWLVSFSWMVFVAARIGSISFAPDYFLSIGYEYAYAGFLASLFTMGSLVISPLTGYLIDKTGREELYLILGGLILGGLYLLLFVTTQHLLLSALIGVVGAVGPVSIFALVPKLLPADRLGKGYGILRICENAGMLAGPFLVGLSYDLSGSYFYSFLLFTVLFLGSSAFAILLKVLLTKKGKENPQTSS